MDKVEFDKLQVGDKICIDFRPEYWGFVEDIHRDTGIIEFDIEEAVGNAVKDTEIHLDYRHCRVLEKTKPQSEIPEFIKTTMQHIATNLETIQAELANCRRQFEI